VDDFPRRLHDGSPISKHDNETFDSNAPSQRIHALLLGIHLPAIISFVFHAQHDDNNHKNIPLNLFSQSNPQRIHSSHVSIVFNVISDSNDDIRGSTQRDYNYKPSIYKPI
jgi:hypothetical protein